MHIPQATHDVKIARNNAVTESIERIRGLEREMGVSRDMLGQVKLVLQDLAAKRHLFPEHDFPVHVDGEGQNAIYLLSEDEDKRFALYMSTSKGAKKVPPHNHTTWAVIVGVNGDEENFFYERTDDGTQDGRGTLRVIGNETVRPGSGVTLMPEDIHHIQTEGETHTLHLHMYGLALDRLFERKVFNMDEGTYRYFPATQNIKDGR